MGISGAATSSAASTAAVPVNAVNEPVAWPAAEHYPGPVDASQYGPGSYTPPGGPAGPTATSAAPDYALADQLPGVIAGGGYQDIDWETGHNGPSTPWDSSAGHAFAPSGALNPELHGQDTGGVFRKEHVTPAAIGSLRRRSPAAQTYDRVAPTQSAIGQTAANGRIDYDQYQDWDPDGHDPWEIPYSERAVLNNVAYQQVPTTDPGTAYGVAGILPDRSPYDYAAQAYQAPPDPVVLPAPASSATVSSGFAGSGWVM